MSKINKDTLTYLGNDFEIRLLAQIVKDLRFGNNIVEILDPNYFSDEYLRIIAAEIKQAKEVDDIVPDLPSLRIRLFNRINDDVKRKYIISNLVNIENASLYDSLKIQEIAITFCKQQELKKSIKKIQKIIDEGNIENYSECEFILRKALEHGDNRDDGMDVLDNFKDVLVEDFRKPIKTGISGLDEVMDGGLAKGELGVILAAFGVGKALPNSNKVYTPEGYKLMGDIKVNDKVFGRNGKETNVIGVYPQGNRPIFKISFNDDTFTFCDEEHLWSVNSINQRNRSSWKDGKRIKLKPDNSFKVIKTKDLINNLTFGSKKSLNFKIPMVEPVEFNKKELPINPYVLGVMLGDGYMKSSSFTTKDIEIVDEISRTNSVKVSIKERCRDIDKDNVLVNQCLYYIRIYGITDKLKKLGLHDKKSDTKFIPSDYLFNSIENRLELLRGLLDTDGNVRKNGGIEYVSTSKILIENVRWLVLSLGGFCKLSSKIPTYTYKGVRKTGKKAYKLTISFPKKSNIIPFKLSRKNDRVVNRVKYDNNKFIKSIEYSHDEEATCIMVDNDEHLFVTDDFIVTHNTTMITKLANTAMNEGYNVLQIFFEDMPKIIQRKHISCWTGIDLNNLSLNKEQVVSFCERKQKESKNGNGQIKLKKFSSDGTTIPVIKQYIRKKIAEGFKPDVVLLDYIDCVQPSKQYDDHNVGEGSVMRQFESMLSELDIAGWTAIQGNRCIWVEEIVTIKDRGNIRIGDVVIGDEILTKEGYKEVTYVFPKEIQKVYEIKTKSGKKIKVSEKHQFPTNATALVSISSGLSVGEKLLVKKDSVNYHELVEDEIVSIELFGKEETIDITVKDTHMFFANDIYTHNSSIKANIVEADQMGGSIKKGQIGHFIVSIAKNLQQKENGTATMAILKSRFGKDGIVFEDIVFDNAKIQIDMNSNSLPRTRIEQIKTKEDNDQIRINEILFKNLRNNEEQ